MKTAIVLFVSLILAFLLSGLAQGALETGHLAFALAPEHALACFVTAALALLLQRVIGDGSQSARTQRPAAPKAPRKAAAPMATPGKTARTQPAASQQGTVKWFNPNKGFGFISCADGSEVFVHYRNIQGSGRRVLRQGQSVRFNIITGEKGPQAEDVNPID